MTSDPHAWLRPFYAALAEQPSFKLLSPTAQFDALVARIETDHLQQAAQMREWDDASRRASLSRFASATEVTISPREVELW